VATDLFSLAGRVALVTGGNSGIGRTLALALRDAGAKVAIGGRRTDRNAAVLAELGVDAAAFELDVCDEASVERTVQVWSSASAARHPGEQRRGREPQIGDGARAQRVGPGDRSQPDRHVPVHQACGAQMTAQRSGKIINIASVNGLTAPSKGLQVAYTASKHGVLGLTRVNAVELAPLGVRVNAIAPGYFLTEMTDELRGTPLEQAINRRTPSGRLGETSQLAGACVYLASAASDHVSGICIPVDGGYLASDGLERG
jgi:NAD(P)-dependent dehydrogenase (short-subunit alcohol dehydrogenase family)